MLGDHRSDIDQRSTRVNDLLLIVPTRGRPNNVHKFEDAFSATTTDSPDVQLLFAIDDDDPVAYPLLMDLRADYIEGPRVRMGPTLNKVALDNVDNYHVIGFAGDDHRLRTPSWDQRILEVIGDKGIVYGNDLLQGATLPTAVFITSNIVKELGYFCLPGALHLFLDNYWKALGEIAGCLTYLDDVIIEHVHPVAGKAEWDEGYIANNASDIWAHDEALFLTWQVNQLHHDAAKVRAL